MPDRDAPGIDRSDDRVRCVVTPHSILFVTQVPIGAFGTVTSIFGNHEPNPQQAPRGGDLVLRYPNGALRFLTSEAGFGNGRSQGANAIAVREPCVEPTERTGAAMSQQKAEADLPLTVERSIRKEAI